MTSEKEKAIKEILKSRKIINKKLKENKMREQLTEEAIEKFQAPVTKHDKIKENLLLAITDKIEETENKILSALPEPYCLPQLKYEDTPEKYEDTPEKYEATPEKYGGTPKKSRGRPPINLLDDENITKRKPVKRTYDVNIDDKINPELYKRYNDLEPPSYYIGKSSERILQKIDKELQSVGGHKGRAKQENASQSNIDEYDKIMKMLRDYKDVIKHIKKYQTGTGLFLNGDEFVERLELLIASRDAGNDSIDIHNEIVDILDKLLNLKLITKTAHKKITQNYLL